MTVGTWSDDGVVILVKEAQHDDDDDEVVKKLLKHDIALLGNGHNEQVSKEQLELIFELYERVKEHRNALETTTNDDDPHHYPFCDYETCRRYLVAREWNVNKAERQLRATLEWRASERPAAEQFWESPKALENPLALNMRIVGWDAHNRPICYTCFCQALDRWDVAANTRHMTLLLEACQNLLRQKRAMGFNKTADTRQCIWVIDFDGFGWRDQNPKSAVWTANLLQSYPELLHLVILVDPPTMFRGIYQLITPLLDDRVKAKVLFAKSQSNKKKDDYGHYYTILQKRLGTEAATWIVNEMKDKTKAKMSGNLKKYWVIPKDNDGEHDSRGMSSYVQSDLYVKTPGDAYEEQKLQNRRN